MIYLAGEEKGQVLVQPATMHLLGKKPREVPLKTCVDVVIATLREGRNQTSGGRHALAHLGSRSNGLLLVGPLPKPIFGWIAAHLAELPGCAFVLKQPIGQAIRI